MMVRSSLVIGLSASPETGLALLLLRDGGGVQAAVEDHVEDHPDACLVRSVDELQDLLGVDPGRPRTGCPRSVNDAVE